MKGLFAAQKWLGRGHRSHFYATSTAGAENRTPDPSASRAEFWRLSRSLATNLRPSLIRSRYKVIFLDFYNFKHKVQKSTFCVQKAARGQDAACCDRVEHR